LQRRSATPSSFEYNNGVKSMFISRFDGGVLLNIDAKSLEIGMSAAISKDPHMIQILLDGKDYHSMTARMMWGISDDEDVPKDVRSKAKSAN